MLLQNVVWQDVKHLPANEKIKIKNNIPGEPIKKPKNYFSFKKYAENSYHLVWPVMNGTELNGSRAASKQMNNFI